MGPFLMFKPTKYFQLKILNYSNHRCEAYLNSTDGVSLGWGYGRTHICQLDEAMYFRSMKELRDFWKSISAHRKRHVTEIVTVDTRAKIKEKQLWNIEMD